MKKYLFITHLTPIVKRSVLRQNMFEVMQQSLLDQSYKNWKALFIGEKEEVSGNIKEVDITNTSDLSNIYLRPDVVDYINDCDYIVKLDDDDVILPNSLQLATKLEFDCYCDLYHTFYDVSSGLVTQQKRNWIAATCIHKKEHAIIHQNGLHIADNFIDSLFYGEHGKDWIGYYKNKNIVYANRNSPVYVRVLSPTSITAGAKKFPVQKIEDIDINHYYQYLKEFGAWNDKRILLFNVYKKQLNNYWKSFSGIEIKKIPNISLFQKSKDKVKYILNK